MTDFAASAQLIGQTMYAWFASFNALFMDDSPRARLLVFIVNILTVMASAELLVLIVLPFLRRVNRGRGFSYDSMASVPSFWWYRNGVIGLRGLKGVRIFEHTPHVTSYGVPFQGVDIPVVFPEPHPIDWGQVWRDSMPSHFPTLPVGSFPMGGMIVRGSSGIGDTRRAVSRDADGNPDYVVFGDDYYAQVSRNVYEQEKMPDDFVGYWHGVYHGPKPGPDIIDV